MKAAMVESVEKVKMPSYKELGTFTGVLVRIPSINDPYMKYIKAHEFNGFSVKAHYRRGEIIDGRLCVSRNFFNIMPEERTSFMVADIKINRKTNENGNSIIVDIHPSKETVATKILKIGSSYGEDGIKIPGTDKYVILEPR